MARRGARARNDNTIAMLAGVVGSAILDAGWELYNLPGAGEASGIEGISRGDVAQFAISNLIALYGFTNANRAAPFGYGMALGNVFTKIIAPSFGLPRYIVFDIKNGAIVPRGRGS